MRVVVLLLMLTFPAVAEERKVFYGTWGTPKQCARLPIKSGGTVLAEPFEINSVGLRQGRIWCRLKWFPVQTKAEGVRTGGFAQCGEDTVRDYMLRMDLSGTNLTLRWGLLHQVGPLSRCSPS